MHLDKKLVKKTLVKYPSSRSFDLHVANSRQHFSFRHISFYTCSDYFADGAITRLRLRSQVQAASLIFYFLHALFYLASIISK
jgi:hypothetical protein